MGTNFYLMSKNKKLMREHFAVETEYTIKNIEYEIVDEPYLGYEVHLCKLSVGWRPLFQRHKTISTFKELEEFCLKNKSIVSIYDEYGRRYAWKQFFERVYNHSQHKAEPRKWIYDINPIFPDRGPGLQTISCTEQEAEIHTPFCHREYNEKEKLAKAVIFEKKLIGMLYGYGKDDRIFQITKSYLHHEMSRGAKAAGVKRIRIHDLRHRFCKLFFRIKAKSTTVCKTQKAALAAYATPMALFSGFANDCRTQ